MEGSYMCVLVLGLCCVASVVWGQGFMNVAIGKTYTQSSKYTIQGNSSNAANGNTGGTLNANNCIHTQVGQNHWWEVDLGRTYPVHDITVWARTGFVSRVFPSTIKVDNQTCVSMTSAPDANRRDKSMTCPSVMYGQVVRLTYTGGEETLNLCEFQIFVPSGVSQCPAGHHGEQCGQNCSNNCGGGPGKNFCYQDTGVCYDGCTGNFAGDMCTEAQGETTKQQAVCESDTDKLIVPVVGSIVGVGLLLTISLTAAVCWINRRREHSEFTDKEDNYYSTPDPVLMLSNTERGLPELPSPSPSSGNREHTEPKTMHTDITDDDYTHPKTIHTGNTGNEYTHPKTIHTGNTGNEYTHPKTIHTGNTGNEYTHPKTIHTGNTGNEYTHPKTIHTGNTGNDYTHPKTIHTGNTDDDYTHPKTIHTGNTDDDYTHTKTIHTGNTDDDYTRLLAVQTINTDEKNTQIKTVRTESPDRQGTQPKTSCAQDAGKQGT